jgi:hypothetical protein
MPINRYCWRCERVVPMLTDEEWKVVSPTVSLKRIKDIRQEYGISIADSMKYLCDKYNEITGYNETNVKAIWHHIASWYGPDCQRCGKPYRTPTARYCAECGFGIEGIK